MAPEVQGALVVAGAALVGTLGALSGVRRQHAGSLIIAALQHMGGGTQERSSGVAALNVLRGGTKARSRSGRRWSRVSRDPWSRYAGAVGQQLFRQAIYVLTHGSRRFYAHEIENVIAMVDMLVEYGDLEFDSAEQQARLMRAVDRYLAEAAGGPDSGRPYWPPGHEGQVLARAEVKVGPSMAALQRRAEDWRPRLDPVRAQRLGQAQVTSR